MQIYKGKERKSSSICWFPPEMAAMAGAGPATSQELGDSSGSCTWVQSPKHLSHFSLLS